MASTKCWRCLSQTSSLAAAPPSIFNVQPSIYFRSSTASFSTRAALNASPPRKSNARVTGPPQRGQKEGVRIKKKAIASKGRPPAIGERKALRKRIVLSNTNALEVADMPELSAETMLDMRLRAQVIGIPGSVVDRLRAVDAFKATQGWGMFRRPGMLMRRESVEMGKTIEDLSSAHLGSTVRRLLTGEKGNGKSMLLLQAMAMAFVKGWVVVSIPEAQELTIGHTEYAPLSNSSPNQYVQKTYIANLLSQIGRANAPVLSGLKLSQKHTLPIPLQSNISLDRLADLGARDPDIAWPIFQALWKELITANTEDIKRPPILLALDGLAHVMKTTQYHDTDVKNIHAHDLVIVKHFMDYLSGLRSLPNGGLVIAATSKSNNPKIPSLELALSQMEARGSGNNEVPQRDPFQNFDDRVFQSLEGVQVTKLQGLTKEEARGLMEYYAKSGVLRQTVSEALVSEKWTLSGGGIVGELERATVKMRI
ncbi:MAG: 37S ribosomal protein S23 mitochondrial [Pleopsidium flavum]|nr:MAG: 37S ribosomal protein S23 mitochondrial [Pleopsidium flavum]